MLLTRLLGYFYLKPKLDRSHPSDEYIRELNDQEYVTPEQLSRYIHYKQYSRFWILMGFVSSTVVLFMFKNTLPDIFFIAPIFLPLAIYIGSELYATYHVIVVPKSYRPQNCKNYNHQIKLNDDSYKPYQYHSCDSWIPITRNSCIYFATNTR